MIEHARADLHDASSRIVQFTDAHDPLWSGVLVLAPGESLRLADGARHDLLVLNGAVDVGSGGTDLRAGAAGAQVLAYRDAAGSGCDAVTVPRDERPWREGRTPGMLVASLCTEGHSVSLVLWQPEARTRHHAHPRGEDIFVVRGELCEDDRLGAGSWIRLHPGAWHAPHVETPTLIFVRSGHLKQRRPAHA